MSIFVLVLTGYSEIYKNSSYCKFFDENINFGHFKLLLACFGLSWPQYQCSKILISVSDLVLTNWIESDWQKNS